MSKNNRYNREFRTPEEVKKEREAEKAVEETVEPVEDDKTDELKTEVKEEKPVTPVTPEIKHGIVICELLNVRTAPEVGDNIIGKLKKNTIVEIITKGGTSNDWYFVKGEMATGVSVSGYVMSKYIKED